jgi:hypothetical protein
LYWRNYVAAHPRRDWPDVTGVWPIPFWIFAQEDWIARVEAEGRAIARAYAKNATDESSRL